MTAIALTGTPRQISSQLSMLVDPSEPFRRPTNGATFTGSKFDALWDARRHYWQMRDAELVLHTELCVIRNLAPHSGFHQTLEIIKPWRLNV